MPGPVYSEFAANGKHVWCLKALAALQFIVCKRIVQAVSTARMVTSHCNQSLQQTQGTLSLHFFGCESHSAPLHCKIQQQQGKMDAMVCGKSIMKEMQTWSEPASGSTGISSVTTTAACDASRVNAAQPADSANAELPSAAATLALLDSADSCNAEVAPAAAILTP